MKQRFKKIPYSFDYIEWDDHASGCGWLQKEHTNTEPVRCVSAGWVIKEDKSVVVLASMLDQQDDFGKSGSRMYILKSCITFRKKLKM